MLARSDCALFVQGTVRLQPTWLCVSGGAYTCPREAAGEGDVCARMSAAAGCQRGGRACDLW